VPVLDIVICLARCPGTAVVIHRYPDPFPSTHDLLRGKVREQAGRNPGPTAAIAGAQVVKASSNVPEDSQGYDAGKRTKGNGI
jgi:hypothetical protein